MRPDWHGSPDLDPAERRGLPYAERDRDLPDAADLAAGWPLTATPDECLCGCGPNSTHHRRI
jgi:hypothetical protein